MRKDSYTSSMNHLVKGLISFNYKQVIDTPRDLIVTLANDVLTVNISIDKVRNKTVLSAYNKQANMSHNDKVLFTSSSTTKELINAVHNHIDNI